MNLRNILEALSQVSLSLTSCLPISVWKCYVTEQGFVITRRVVFKCFSVFFKFFYLKYDVFFYLSFA